MVYSKTANSYIKLKFAKAEIDCCWYEKLLGEKLDTHDLCFDWPRFGRVLLLMDMQMGGERESIIWHWGTLERRLLLIIWLQMVSMASRLKKFPLAKKKPSQRFK